MTTDHTFSLGLSKSGYRDWNRERAFIVHRVRGINSVYSFCGRYTPYKYSYIPSRKQISCEDCKRVKANG